jgi:DNA-binding response OmpR family regulator
MARPHLLLVDADPRALRVLEVNLKNDGFSVTTAMDGAEALERMEVTVPNVVVAETRLPRVDGFELVRRLRQLPGGDKIPVLLIAPEAGPPGPGGLSASATDRLRAVELGIADCLTKPVSVRELVTRVNLMLARRTQALLASGSPEQTHFSGHLQDVGVIDLIQAFEVGRRSGVLQIEHGKRLATIVFKDGKVIDAEQGQQRGEEALYRTFLWTTGIFDVEFVEVDAPDNISIGTAALVMEGMRRIDEWGRLAEQLPSSASVFTVDPDAFLERLAEIPDELNPVLRLFDGQRTLMAVIDESPFDDLSTLTVVSKLFFEGVLRVAEPVPTSLLVSGRALAVGVPRAGGNVIKLPHTSEPSVASVRPNAPPMRPDPIPRSLVYSEPPQSLRLSQRVGETAGVGVASHFVASVLPTAVVPSAPPRFDAKSADGVLPKNIAVPEAEFEDVREAAELNPDRGSVAPETLPDGKSLPSRAPLPAVAPAAAAVSPKPSIEAEDSLGSETVETGERHTRPSSKISAAAVGAIAAPGMADHLEHDDFFREGEAYEEASHDGAELHPDSIVDRDSSDRADIEIDPRVLAAIQARRAQGARWVKWTIALALLLLSWGIVQWVRSDDDAVAEHPKAGAPEAPSAVAAPVVTATPVSEPEPEAEFEETPAPASTVSVDFTPVSGATPRGSSSAGAPPFGSSPFGGTPAASPRSPSRSGKPPTARFPSTPENQ